MSERNDVPLKRNYKYKCLETCCTAVVDDKKWHRHCQRKHRYKTASHMVVKRTIVEVRVGKGPWMPYCETSAAASSPTASLSRSSATPQENVSTHGAASPDPGNSSSSQKIELTCESVGASLDAWISTAYDADNCRLSVSSTATSSSTAGHSRSPATPQENVSAHGTASSDPGNSLSSSKAELTCASVDASISAAFIADDCRRSPMTVLPESAVAVGCHQWSIHDSKPELGIVSATPGIGSFAISDAEAVDSENTSCTEADLHDPALFIRQRIDANMINFSTAFSTTRATVRLSHTINCLQSSCDNSDHQCFSGESHEQSQVNKNSPPFRYE